MITTEYKDNYWKGFRRKNSQKSFNEVPSQQV